MKIYVEASNKRKQGGKYVRSSSIVNDWRSFISQLEEEMDEIYDPLNEMTDLGEELLDLTYEVNDSLGIWIEPSVQGGQGGIWFYRSSDDEVILEDYDYSDFDSTVLDIAAESSSADEFKARYKSFLKGILKM